MSNNSIVQLGIDDKERIERLLNNETSFNGFVISDLQHGKYEPEFVRIYGEIEGHELKSLLLDFQDKIVYYSPEERDVEGYIEYIQQSNAPKLVGKKVLIEKFVPLLHIQANTDCQVRELSTVPREFLDDALVVKRMTTREEASALYDLFVQVEEYGFTGNDREKYIDEQIRIVETDSIRTYVAEFEGEMVSTAAYVNDRPRTAIVIGVATPPQHRRKGYASKVLYRLCMDAINTGKVLYLFYTNPQAGSVYQHLGFSEGGEWKVLTLR